MEIKNARIASIKLGRFEHFWGARICFKYFGTSQRIFLSIDKIRTLLETLDIRFWESLPGMNCRVKADTDDIYAIGHYLEDQWIEV